MKLFINKKGKTNTVFVTPVIITIA